MKLSPRLSALRHRQFLKFWLASFMSVGAVQLQVMGLGWLVYEISGSALDLGYLGAALGLPAILMTLFGGALADRLDKKLLLSITSLLIAGLLGLLAWLDLSGAATVWNVIAIAGAISIINGIDWPVRNAIFPALIERGDMMSAVSLTTVIWQVCRMVMPAIGGVIIAISDTWVLFAMCSLGFLVMFGVLLTLEVRAANLEDMPRRQSTLHQIFEGLRFIMTDRTFLVLFGLSYAVMFFVSSYVQLMPAFTSMLGKAEQGYGLLLSVTGAGAVIGTLVSGSFQGSRFLGRAMLTAALLYAGFVYLFTGFSWIGWAFSYPLALIAIMVSATFASLFLVTSTTILQLQVPDRLRGRVMGLHAISYNLSTLGGLFIGALASWSNPSAAVAASTSVFVLFLLWVILTQQEIRSLDGQALTEKSSV